MMMSHVSNSSSGSSTTTTTDKIYLFHVSPSVLSLDLDVTPSQRPVPRLQQQSLQVESGLRGDEGLVEPAGQEDHAEVRGRGVGHFLEDGLLQPQLLTEGVQQETRRDT